MYNDFTPSLLLFLLALFVIFFPHWFVLRKYQKGFENFFSDRFRLFHFFQIGWMVISAIGYILIMAFWAADNHLNESAAWTMFVASMALPSALFAAVTGIYPEISRKGYHYYEHHSSFSGQTPVLTDYPHLKIVGWIQFFFLVVIIGVSAAYILS